jgi:hypothetical protein
MEWYRLLEGATNSPSSERRLAPHAGTAPKAVLQSASQIFRDHHPLLPGGRSWRLPLE